MMPCRTARGFTLIEVLLALAILSSVMLVLGQTMGASARAYDQINATRQGYQVAADKLVELQVYQQWPSLGTSDSQVSHQEQRWWLRTRVSAGPFPDTRRVDIEVGKINNGEQENAVYTLASLIGKPAQ